MSSKSPVRQGGDMFKTNLQPAPLKSSQIPANGSWWIVQVQPTKAISQKPRRCARSSSGVFENPGSFSAHSVRFEEVMVRRKDLNNPPTDVGWDSVTLQTSLLVGPMLCGKNRVRLGRSFVLVRVISSIAFSETSRVIHEITRTNTNRTS